MGETEGLEREGEVDREGSSGQKEGLLWVIGGRRMR